MKIIFAVEDLFIIEPLGIMQLIAGAKKLQHQCFFATYGKGDALGYIKRINPDVVAVSIMSISDESAREFVNAVKNYRKDIFVVVGGPHPTYYPEFIENCDANAICIGEGDEAFIDLLKTLEKNGDVKAIANIRTKNSSNPPRPLIENLDELPFLDRDLVYQNTRMGKSKIKSFMATRGCPFSCTYCFNNGYKELYKGKGKILRRRSVDSLIEEINSVKANYSLELVRFGDDVFIGGENDWLIEFADKYSKSVKLPFYCLLSPKMVTKEVVKQLKRAGCVSVSTSIETGNEKTRYEILKRRISDEEIINACRLLVENGIRTYTNFMVGLPNAKIEDEIKSLELAVKAKTTCAAVTIFTPFPGTELYNQCLEKGLLPKTKNPVFPRSTTDRSMLNCFSEKEKDIQRNILLLGTLANGSRILRGLILRFLIYLRPNRIFFYISFLVRNYYNYRYIWPMKLSAKEFLYYLRVVFRNDKKYIR